MAIRIQVRRDSSLNWSTSNPILKSGEVGFDTTVNKFKVGTSDTSRWNTLPYLNILPSELTELAQDAVAQALAAGEHTHITVTYNDETGKINIGTAPEVVLNSSLYTSLGGYVLTSVYEDEKGTAGGIATLDLNGKVPDDQIDASIARDSEVAATYETKTNVALKAPIASPTFTGTATATDLVVNGDFTVNGNNFSASATSITIEDNLVQLAHQNPSNAVDLGIVVAYNDGTPKHAGIARDVSENKWKLFKGVTTEPSTLVAFDQGSLDALQVGAFEASSATIGNVSNTELQYLDGVTSGIQSQINLKAPIADPTFTGTVSGITKAMVGLGNVDNTSDATKALVQFNPQAGAYQLTLSDAGKMIEMSAGGAVSIPTDALANFPNGTQIDILQTGDSQVTIQPVNGTVIVNATPGFKLRAKWSSATLIKRSTNLWVAIGDLAL
jgi:hypothetical protein